MKPVSTAMNDILVRQRLRWAHLIADGEYLKSTRERAGANNPARQDK